MDMCQPRSELLCQAEWVKYKNSKQNVQWIVRTANLSPTGSWLMKMIRKKECSISRTKKVRWTASAHSKPSRKVGSPNQAGGTL